MKLAHTASSTPLAVRVRDAEVFGAHHVMTVDQRAGGLVVEAPLAVRSPAMLSGNLPLQFLVATAPPLRLAGLSLPQANLALSLLEVPGASTHAPSDVMRTLGFVSGSTPITSPVAASGQGSTSQANI